MSQDHFDDAPRFDDALNAASLRAQLSATTRARIATLDIVDRACILHDGTVLMDGTPADIIAHEDVRRVYLGEGFSL